MDNTTIRRIKRGTLMFYLAPNTKLYVKTNYKSQTLSQTFILKDSNSRSTKETKLLLDKIERGYIKDLTSLMENCQRISWAATGRKLC